LEKELALTLLLWLQERQPACKKPVPVITNPSPPVDIICAVMIVWRIRGKIIRTTVMCCVNQATGYASQHSLSSSAYEVFDILALYTSHYCYYYYYYYLVHVLSQDKLGWLQQEGHLAQKWGDDGGGSLFSADGVAPSWIVSVSASVTFPCTIKSRRSFFLAPAHPVSRQKRTVKWLCVRACVRVLCCVVYDCCAQSYTHMKRIAGTGRQNIT